MSEPLSDASPKNSPSQDNPGQIGRQPRGLVSLVICEAWLAYSLYGFGSMLVLYAADHVLHHDVLHSVIGMSICLTLLNWLFGATTQTALSAALSSAYFMGIFLSPVAAGILTDLYFGFRNAFLAGMVLSLLGFLLLSSAATFLLALIFFIVGFGLMRAVLPAQLGQLYGANDPRRAEGYQYFSLGLQITAIIAPLAGGLAQRHFGWGAAFFVIGLGLPLSALSYRMGWRDLPRAATRQERAVKAPLVPSEKRALLLIFGIIVTLAINSVPNSQMMSAYELWGGQHFDLRLFGLQLPVSSLISLDGIISAATGIMIIALWRIWSRYQPVPSEMAKIVIGGLVTIFGPLALSAGAFVQPQPHQVSLWWAVLFHIINDFGFGLSYATGMALIANIAPESIKTTMISIFPISAFLGNFLAGRLAAYLDKMTSVAFWNMHAAVSLFGALLIAALYLWHRHSDSHNQARDRINARL